MRGQSTTSIAVMVLIIIILLGAGAWWFLSPPSTATPVTQVQDQAEQQAVDTVVTNFGKQLQMVPLSASSTGAASAIANYYAPYVVPEVLADWEATPSSAPGRLTSSPWPDRIDITSTTKNADGTYTVQGTVAEVTSVEVQNGGTANTYPVTITLANRSGVWLIVDFSKE